MKYLNRKGRLAVIALLGIAITVFSIEYLSYIYNRSSWTEINMGGDVALKVLFVADPQIQGETQESFLYGWVSRWDADRYLSKNYRLAKEHVSPDVVVFLGDLFDEGSIANDPEYRRYFQRFRNIFDLPTNQNPSEVKYIFVPGDNDVGGEKSEPVDPVKVSWFAKTFGGLRSVTNVYKPGMDVQFVKMNLFMPNEYKNPLRGYENVINGTKKPDFRLIVSHVSLISYMTQGVEQVLENFHPDLIVSAHSHQSAMIRLATVGKNEKKVHIVHDFLMPNRVASITSESGPDLSNHEYQQHYAQSFRLQLKNPSNADIHEIIVPTCSYRMGVENMGYGALELYQNGTVTYTVLWLPSRFKQLFLYIAIYILVKIILTPWVFWKIGSYVYNKLKVSNILQRANNYYYTKIV